MVNLHQLTPHAMPSYTHKMAIVSWPQILWRHFTQRISIAGARAHSERVGSTLWSEEDRSRLVHHSDLQQIRARIQQAWSSGWVNTRLLRSFTLLFHVTYSATSDYRASIFINVDRQKKLKRRQLDNWMTVAKRVLIFFYFILQPKFQRKSQGGCYKCRTVCVKAYHTPDTSRKLTATHNNWTNNVVDLSSAFTLNTTLANLQHMKARRH